MGHPPEGGPAENDVARSAGCELIQFSNRSSIVSGFAPIITVLFSKGENRAIQVQFFAPPAFASDDDALALRHVFFNLLFTERKSVMPQILGGDGIIDDDGGHPFAETLQL